MALGGVAWHRHHISRPAALLRRLPTRDALIVSVDFSALRRAGLLQMLAASQAGSEPEYQQFVRRTGFDYQRDLDLALVAFTPGAKYFLLRGRFDWPALRGYVAKEGGQCADDLCRMQGSSPERRISFFPIQSDVMALAVSPADSAVLALASADREASIETPAAPLWVSVPPAALHTADGLPTGTRMFARGMETAEGMTLSLDADGRRFAARLDVRCRNAKDSAAIAQQLTTTTTLLREMIEREHKQPNSGDFSGVLTSGAFRSEGPRVLGYWPIERAFLDNLLRGEG
jgi:hypothetical protein